jgi:hypothetical protein
MVEKKLTQAERKLEAGWSIAQSILGELTTNDFSKSGYEQHKNDGLLRGKISWETWKRYYTENKEEVLAKLETSTEYKDVNGTVYNILNTKEKRKFEVLSLKELYEYECPPYTWRIQKIIKDKKIMAIAGDSAVYKSWLCLAMGLCVAKGIPFLDNFTVEQGGVLFVDRENSIPELQNRIEMVANGLGISKEEELPIHFLSEQSLTLDKPEDRDFLEQYVKENSIKLIIVDTYRRVISFDENDAGLVSYFLNECIKPICEKMGASFIFIHHHKKGKSNGNQKDRLRGSSDFVNLIDGVIQIERKNSKITIKQTKSRSGKELEPFEVEIETDEEKFFKFIYLGEKQDNSALAMNCKKILVWFGEKDIAQFKAKEATEALSIPKQRVYEALSELIKRNMVKKGDEGQYIVIKQQTLN